jgi:hypothetical protein
MVMTDTKKTAYPRLIAKLRKYLFSGVNLYVPKVEFVHTRKESIVSINYFILEISVTI